MPPTKYVVLEQNGDTYAEAGQVEAHGPTAAAKKVSDSGQFLVVPVSNAHLVTLTVETPKPVTRSATRLLTGASRIPGQATLEGEQEAAELHDAVTDDYPVPGPVAA